MQSSTLPEKMGLPADDRGDIVCEAKGNVLAIHGLYVAGAHGWAAWMGCWQGAGHGMDGQW